MSKLICDILDDQTGSGCMVFLIPTGFVIFIVSMVIGGTITDCHEKLTRPVVADLPKALDVGGWLTSASRSDDYEKVAVFVYPLNEYDQSTPESQTNFQQAYSALLRYWGCDILYISPTTSTSFFKQKYMSIALSPNFLP